MRYLITFCIVLYFPVLYGQTLTSSNLPIVIINTNNKTINETEKIIANMKIIFNGNGQRNNISDNQYNYNGLIGIKLRGNSSLSFNQKQYTVETKNALGEDLSTSLLDMPEENDWVLNAPYNDVSMIRNTMAYTMWSEMGHWGPRTRMVEVILNDSYLGIYTFTEKIKRDNSRINISKLKSTDIAGLDVTGGYIVRIDPPEDGEPTFTSKVNGVGSGVNKKVVWLYYYPKPDEILPAQMSYIQSYIDTVEQVLQSVNYNDPINGYVKYLDLGSFVDYFIHTELSLNADGYKRSAYFYKDKRKVNGSGGKLYVGSVWDFNLAYGNCNFCNANKITTWVYDGCETNPTPALWKRLTQDTTFMNAVKCRYVELREGILSNGHLDSFIDNQVDLLNEAQQRHFSKWTELFGGSTGGWGGWGISDPLWYAAYRVTSYSQEITTLKKWINDRLVFLDNNLGGICRTPKTENNLIHYFDLSVYPNPVTQYLNVVSAKPLNKIEIYTHEGRKIWNQQISNEKVLKFAEFEKFTNGVYELLFYAEDGTRISRRVIKR